MKHLLHVFPTFGIGGAEARTADIIQKLDTNFSHTIIAMEDDYSCSSRLGLNIPIVYSDWRVDRNIEEAKEKTNT